MTFLLRLRDSVPCFMGGGLTGWFRVGLLLFLKECSWELKWGWRLAVVVVVVVGGWMRDNRCMHRLLLRLSFHRVPWHKIFRVP